MRPQRARWSSSIFLLAILASLGVAGASWAQAPAGAPPAVPPAPVPAAPVYVPPAPASPPPAAAPAPAPAAVPAAPAVTPPPAASMPMVPVATPFKVETPTGTLRIGLLLQPQYSIVGSPALNGNSENLYLRRMRILVTGTMFGRFDYFVDTDSPNLFLSGAPTTGDMFGPALKTGAGMAIQDAFITYKPLADMKPLADALKIDAGYMLPPMAHNAIQGATTLYSWDYFTYTFQHTNAFGAALAPVGRDLGVQVRGLVVDGHIEYRAGMFQGLRERASATDVAARNFFRVTARLQVNLFDPEPGFFYAGTYFGTKKILSVGGSYDFQDSYKYYAGDAFLDMPVGPGVLTAQVEVAHWDGGTFLVAPEAAAMAAVPALPKQTAISGEAGYTFLPVKISPIVRFDHLSSIGATGATSRYGGGLAFWPYGHSSNLKLFYTRVQVENAAHGFNQVNLQWQLFFL